MQHTSHLGIGRSARARRCSMAFGLIAALTALAVPPAVPSESRICVGAMQTTACVPPA